jgi:putative hydrolase of the HAD superfamily
MKNINTIIFDFGGVLLNLNMQACIDAFARLGYNKIDELIDHYKQKGIFLLFEEGKLSTDDFFTELQKIVGLQVPVEDLKQAYISFLGDLPAYKLNLILELRKKYKVYMLSNINHFVFEHCKKTYFDTDNHVVEDYFDKAFLSFEMKVCKPDKLIFEKMIKDADLIPEQCLFLDDGIKNIETAKDLGFNTLWVKRDDDVSLQQYIDKALGGHLKRGILNCRSRRRRLSIDFLINYIPT